MRPAACLESEGARALDTQSALGAQYWRLLSYKNENVGRIADKDDASFPIIVILQKLISVVQERETVPTTVLELKTRAKLLPRGALRNCDVL